MEITLRGKQYKAEHLTDTNYLPITNLFVDDDGRLVIENVEDPGSLSPSAKNKAVQPMIKRLSDPDQKAAIAHSLSAIFPSFPRELIRYAGKHDFAMNLTLEELLTLAVTLGSALTPDAAIIKPSAEELAQAANIARLEEELKLAKSGRGFGNGAH